LDLASYFICTASASDFEGFLPFLIFSFHIAFSSTPPKIEFLILWAAAYGVHRNSLVKSGIFSDISLAHLSTVLKNRPDEKR